MTTALRPRLRVAPAATPFHVALLEPEIPPNTGSIARLCAATCTPLHLIGRLGFRIDEKSVRRAGVDYWHLVNVRHHPDLDHFAREFSPARWVLLCPMAQQSYVEFPYAPGDVLLFGKESVGLPADLLATHSARSCGIPTSGGVRSLNLAMAAGIVLFEALRATGNLQSAGLEELP